MISVIILVIILNCYNSNQVSVQLHCNPSYLIPKQKGILTMIRWFTAMYGFTVAFEYSSYFVKKQGRVIICYYASICTTIREMRKGREWKWQYMASNLKNSGWASCPRLSGHLCQYVHPLYHLLFLFCLSFWPWVLDVPSLQRSIRKSSVSSLIMQFETRQGTQFGSGASFGPRQVPFYQQITGWVSQICLIGKVGIKWGPQWGKKALIRALFIGASWQNFEKGNQSKKVWTVFKKSSKTNEELSEFLERIYQAYTHHTNADLKVPDNIKMVNLTFRPSTSDIRRKLQRVRQYIWNDLFSIGRCCF